MPSDNSTAIHHVYSDGDADSDAGTADSDSGTADSDAGDEPHQVLEVQMKFYMRMISGVSRFILYETAPIPYETALFPLPVRELNDDPVFLQIYIADFLSLLNIPAADSEVIAGQVASYILQITEENRDTNFHVTAVVNNILYTYGPLFLVQTWLRDGTIGEEEAPADVERFGMEKLEEINGEEEDLGICCICLDEINCKKTDVVKIPCGHVYHKPCVFTWLLNSNSCPLCRTSLPLEEGSY